MTRNTRWLLAGLTLTLSACGAGGPEAEAPTSPPSHGDGVSSLREVEAALGALPGAQVLDVHPDGVPALLKGALGATGRPISGASAWQAHALLEPTLARVLPAFRLKARDLVPVAIRRDGLGHSHVRYAQTKAGLPVVGEELLVHLDEAGRVYLVNGNARDGEALADLARISPDVARRAALAATPGGRTAEAPREVFVRPTPDAALVRAFEVVVSGEDSDGTEVRDHVFLSAADGTEVLRTSDIHPARNRRVCSVGGPTSGTCRLEGQAATGDTGIDKTYDNLGLFYDCFQQNFARDSFDGSGGQLFANVHYGTQYTNAFWNGTTMVCGDGDGTSVGPPCSDPDIVVHELTHGVTDYTSDLVYSGQSGALNESLSDIFAATCGSWATGTWSTATNIWRIGELFWTPNTPGDALRYMDNPALDGASLDYYTQITSSSDVHYASGVPNLAFKLLSTGGTHPQGKSTVNVTGIGVQAAGRIFYYANANLFLPSTTLAQAKTLTKQAAQSLGYSAAIQASVEAAWTAVGVGAVTPPPTCLLLPNDLTLAGITGASGSEQYYCLDVPANTASTITVSGGTGDVDLYTRFGGAPTTSLYNCRPYLGGNNETCTLAAQATAGRQWILLKAFSAYSGVSLSVHY
ncbi:M4 family metallopeptidase [Corallococcus llansteffanensis]|uniref:Neutral metalloproteinase n=1 Tax=Corallococcus llansteffanensis TaxID=2316731 RepID=A0A3A8QLA7_9BACT|nr:M4 family metallopeptidase [Corallococcus llansteffanensis]RKH67125.1 peptidase M4 [Corallococcus llansteffanensis]